MLATLLASGLEIADTDIAGANVSVNLFEWRYKILCYSHLQKNRKQDYRHRENMRSLIDNSRVFGLLLCPSLLGFEVTS